MNQRIIGKFYFSCLTFIICLSLFVGLVGEIKPVAASEPQSSLQQDPPAPAVMDRYGFRDGASRSVYAQIGVLVNDGTLPTGAYAEFYDWVGVGPHGSLGTNPDATSGLRPTGYFTYYSNNFPNASGMLTDQFRYIIKNSLGVVIAGPTIVTVTNTLTCTNDSNGPNDEAGQKDLTQFCKDTNIQTQENELAISWNWDEISLSGGNTADACALFDTDDIQNGLVDYAVCMRWSNGIVPALGFPLVYPCNDTKPDRCAGAGAPFNPPGLSCQLIPSNDDPFAGGDLFPRDAKSFCSVSYGNVFSGITTINFLDVCSFPSGQPNSDASDCVMKSWRNAVLKVITNVEPNLAFGVTAWDIHINPAPLFLSSTFVDTVYGDDETPSFVLPAGTYTISESSSRTNPDGFKNPTTKYQCKNIGVTPVVYDPVSPQTLDSGRSFSRAVVAGDVWECTFTNTFNPTAVSLLSFESKVVSGGVLLTWETAEETDNLGFNLYRSSSPDGAKVRLNTELIPTKTYPGSTFGALYDYLDTNVVSGVTYHYWLEDIGLDGNQVNSVHETSIQPRWLYIPTMSR